MSNENINKNVAKGAVWMVGLRFCVKGIGLVSTMILARLLMPADFGLMAIASSVYALIELMQAFGFDTVLIQKQNASRSHYDTAWTLQVIFSICSSSILIATSSLAADYYDDWRLAPVLSAMSLLTLMNGLNNIGLVEFRKQLSFNKEFLFQLLIKLSGFCVTVPLAFYWHSYWALICGMLSSNFASLILSYMMQNYRPRISLKEWRDVLGFSSWLFINNVLFFLSQHAQNFILGKFGGSNALGLLSISNEIATLVTGEIVAPINRASFPGYSKVADKPEQLRALYLKVIGYIVVIACPSAIGIAAIAPVLVPVMLGAKWLPAVPIIQIIALASFITAINTNSGYIYLALAKQKIVTTITILWLLILIPSIFFLSMKEGALGVAKAMLFTATVMFPVYQGLLKIILGLSLWSMIQVLYRPILSSLTMGWVVYQVTGHVSLQRLNIEGLAWLIGIVAIGAVTFAVVLLLLWWLAGRKDGVEKDSLSLLANKLKFKSMS